MFDSSGDVIERNLELTHTPLVIVVVEVDRVKRLIPQSCFTDASLSRDDARPARVYIDKVERLEINILSDCLEAPWQEERVVIRQNPLGSVWGRFDNQIPSTVTADACRKFYVPQVAYEFLVDAGFELTLA